MLRAIWLTVQNEARLLLKDPIVLFMLLFAPVVIITVAGYSLGSLYGGVASSFHVPIVDEDRGAVSDAILSALRRERSIVVEPVDSAEDARRLVSHRDRTPIAIVVPPGTTAAIARGEQPHLVLFIDPVRRIEVNELELRIDDLCRRIARRARLEAQARLNRDVAALLAKVRRASAQTEQASTSARLQLQRIRVELQASIRAQIVTTLSQAGVESQRAIEAREKQAWAEVQNQLAERQAALADLGNYLAGLRSSQRAFEDWFTKLKQLAGSHAADIPPPPSFPPSPPATELALLNKPITRPRLDGQMIAGEPVHAISIKLPEFPELTDIDVSAELEGLKSFPAMTLPGTLSFAERPAIEGEAVMVNAFDQYVPGFGVTFLLIGMMLGIALTLFDERDWGTLKRLQVSGAPLTGLLMGKLFARFVVGTVQMVLLFIVGWALFGISLGRNPLALLLPTIGISFSAAALGLVIASVARAHDSVMPLGTVTSMSMAAIGGCWWPLDFEPGWMRAVARWLPTTWTMEAFNNLMIRNLPAASVLVPFIATVGLGAILLAVGTLRLVRIED